MSILVKCQCGQQFLTADKNAGQPTKCPECGRGLVIPERDGPTAQNQQVSGLDGAITSGKAISSLLLGLSSLVFIFLAGIPAVLLGLSSLVDIKEGVGLVRGRRLALAGIGFGFFGSTVVTAIVLRPAVVAARDAVYRSQCQSNLKQIALGLHQYHARHDTFPAAAISSSSGQPLLSWRVAILEDLGPAEIALFKKFRLNEPWNSPHNLALIPEMPAYYRCPADRSKGTGLTNYVGVGGNWTMFPGTKGVKVNEVTDGTSATLFIVESAKAVNWTEPSDLSIGSPLPALGTGSAHRGIIHGATVDGAVHTFDPVLLPGRLNALLSRAGGEVVYLDD